MKLDFAPKCVATICILRKKHDSEPLSLSLLSYPGWVGAMGPFCRLVFSFLRLLGPKRAIKNHPWRFFAFRYATTTTRHLEDMHTLQSSAIRWVLGCVNSRPTARGIQEAGFTQPRAHLIAHLCTYYSLRTHRCK